MDVRIFIVLVVVSTQLKLICSFTTSIAGEISDDVRFIYKTFPVPPSNRAITEVNVSFPERYIVEQNQYLRMIIYTTKDHINIRSNQQCTQVGYGQLGNRKMLIRIKCERGRYRIHKCLKESDDNIHCTGNITIQDFIPRNFSFSFGFLFDTITALSSLKNLVYNITIYGQTNETKCIELPYNNMKLCNKYFQHTALPNLIGHQDIREILKYDQYFQAYKEINQSNHEIEFCHQHLEELACHVLVPKCDPVSKQVIHPCREMCYDLRTACSKGIILSDKIPRGPSGDNKIVVDYTKFDCDYLPSLEEDIPCFYKPVTCKSPPTVNNSTMLNVSMSYNNYSVLDTVDYSCSEGFQMVGNKKISCMYSGEWSTPPKCSLYLVSITPLIVILPVLLIPMLILLVTVIVRSRIKLKKQTQPDLKNYHQVELDTILMEEIKGTDRPLLPLKRQLDSKRNSFFDAFVLFHFDSNNSFILDQLVPELEEKRKFRLCVHSRNFIPGRDIKDNIEDAIQLSSSAIIIMSQGFVDSPWCKEEFTHCYIENMNDDSFNLFVIMMQPADTLVNISNYMKIFFANKTYLDVNDPELFPRLATQLENIRFLEDDDVNDVDGNDDN